jgi:cytoskeletal protein CcmA (bactofilin family)
MQQEPASIGKSIVIRGEVSGSEDLTVEGRVEGKIELRDHILIVGSNGQVHAHIVGKSIIVLGQVKGNLTAADKVEIREKGSVEGDIVAPRVAIADGANFRGSIDMRREEPSKVPTWNGGLEPDATSMSATRESVSV